MGLRSGPNVAIAQGDLYPNGVWATPPDPNIQATVRPEGHFFKKSPGYESIRPGRNKFQDACHGMGIHFTPQRFAEDVGEFDSLPLLVDEETSVSHADIADLPGSERLDDAGKLTAQDAAANRGVKLGETAKAAPDGGSELHTGNRSVADMGDREPGRPLTRAAYGLLKNPAGSFRDEYADNPMLAVGVAGAIIGGVYFLTREFESGFRSRRRTAAAAGGITGAAAPVVAAPAAAADAAGAAVQESADVANRAATAAGEAAKDAASAAGDVAAAAGDAASEVTDAVADAVTGDAD